MALIKHYTNDNIVNIRDFLRDIKVNSNDIRHICPSPDRERGARLVHPSGGEVTPGAGP